MQATTQLANFSNRFSSTTGYTQSSGTCAKSCFPAIFGGHLEFLCKPKTQSSGTFSKKHFPAIFLRQVEFLY